MATTVILIHGAFAESSSWARVTESITASGHRAVAYANPLRGVAEDAAGLTELVRSIEGPKVLVGHSYGGAVMTNVATDVDDVVGLVFVAAFALDAGESAGDVAGSVPGSSLGDTVEAVPRPGGGVELHIAADRYHNQFCADLPEGDAALMAITQRPITEAALSEPSGSSPLWRTVPSYFVFGGQDRNIPVEAHRNMAERAKAVRTVEVPEASHVVGMSHPDEAFKLILDAVDHHG